MNTRKRKLADNPQELARLLVERANAGDVDGMVELYKTEAPLVTGSTSVAIGKVQIREFHANLLSTGLKFNVGDQRPAILNGELALTSTRLPNGAITAAVARKQPDGTWRWIVDQQISSSNAYACTARLMPGQHGR